jgi:hypothetical protein
MVGLDQEVVLGEHFIEHRFEGSIPDLRLSPTVAADTVMVLTELGDFVVGFAVARISSLEQAEVDEQPQCPVVS